MLHSLLKTTLFTALLAAVFLSGCKNSTTEGSQPTAVNLLGNWISQDFAEMIQQNHSPHQTMKALTLYASEIRLDSLHADSVVVYNGQMGYAALPAQRRGDTLRIKLNQDPYTDLTYDTETKTLFFIDKTLNRVFRFFRADSSWLDTSYEMPIAFPTLVNQATFSGEWRAIEEGKTDEQMVSFLANGQSKGWRNYDTYSVCVNGDCAVSDNSDVVLFLNKETTHAYGFRAKADTLTLFDLKPNATAKGRFTQGKPVALFIRKPKS